MIRRFVGALALTTALCASLPALADDLAVYHFWPALFAFCRFANGGLAAGGLPPGDAARLLASLSCVLR